MTRPSPAKTLCLSLLAMAGPALWTPAMAQDNTPISRAQVPASVLQTARHYAPAIVFLNYGYEDEPEGRIYEFTGRDAQGHTIEIDVRADGRLQEIEIETEWDEVPISVQIELSLTDAAFVPHVIEASTRPDGTTVYEFEGLNRLGAPGDIEILHSGTGVTLLTAHGVPQQMASNR